MFLAAILLCVVYILDHTSSKFLLDYVVAVITLSIIIYIVFNLCLDIFKRIPPRSIT